MISSFTPQLKTSICFIDYIKLGVVQHIDFKIANVYGLVDPEEWRIKHCINSYKFLVYIVHKSDKE